MFLPTQYTHYDGRAGVHVAYEYRNTVPMSVSKSRRWEIIHMQHTFLCYEIIYYFIRPETELRSYIQYIYMRLHYYISMTHDHTIIYLFCKTVGTLLLL